MSFNLIGISVFLPVWLSFYFFKVGGFTLFEIEYDCEWVTRDLIYTGRAITISLCGLHFTYAIDKHGIAFYR